MKEINRSFKTTFVFSTHDKKVIAKADRLVRIEDGRIRRLGVRTDDGWVLVKERRRAPSATAERSGGGRKVIRLKFLARCGGPVRRIAARGVRRTRRSAASDAPRLRFAAAEPPLSKDALFGDDRGRPDPRPKDALFGTPRRRRKNPASSSAARSTVSAPTRTRTLRTGRAASAASRWPPRASFRENVKWKAGRSRRRRHRLRDVRFLSRAGQAQPALQRVLGRELPRLLAPDSWDFRLGAQQIIWGEVVGLFFADVVSARDMREFLLPSFDIIRIPQWAARAEYFAGDSHVEFIWIPVPAFDRIGKPGADFYPAPLPSPTPPSVAALFLDPQRPDRNLGNSNYGVRANTLVSGWDIAAFYYRSFSTSADVLSAAHGHARRSRSCFSRATTGSGRRAAR